jgi:S-DNA-T family DNA segregation ATPase FtsK/SpoIIIE
MLGAVLGGALAHALGYIGATLFLLALMVVSFSLYTGLSWLRFVDWLGGLLEDGYLWARNAWQTRQDKRIGAQAMQERSIVVEEEKKRVEEHEPIHIEMPVYEVPRSKRVEKEKQVSLFAEIRDSDLPPLHLLDEAKQQVEVVSAETLEFTSRLIERKLKDFGVEVKVVGAYPGPVITRYEIDPSVGVKGSQIVNLARDLARALSVVSIRVVETIPGKSCMGLELPNPRRQLVRLVELLSSAAYNDMPSPLSLALGKDIAGKPVIADLGRMPHLLVAGTTGSGKSVALNAMILSLIYKAEPRQVRLILIDPKMLELSVYEGIAHLLAPVVTDVKLAANALNWCVGEMERRYRLMSTLGVRNLAGYNARIVEARKARKPLTNPFSLTPESPEPIEEMPLIVVVIDELADLMMATGRKIEELIARIAQKARAAGIHVILATQRPSVNVITGLIKANIPSRIAFQVASKIDSRTILDQMGAETLLGQGDMLYLPPGIGHPQRVHGAFVSDGEVHRVVEHLKTQGGPQYLEGILDAAGNGDAEEGVSVNGGDAEADPMYDQAVAVVLKTRRPSISLVQRHLRIGYNRAARLIEQMERAGLVSSMATNGNREVLAQNRE